MGLELIILTGSISRSGGGIFDAVRKPARILNDCHDVSVKILSLKDEFSETDLKFWLPVVPEVVPFRGPGNFGYAPALRYRLEKDSPDILHTHGIWMYQSLVSMKYCLRNKVPYIVSPHGMLDPWALNNSGWKKKIAGVFYENKNLHGAFCLHALNEAEQQGMRAYGLKNPICRIPNGIDIVSCPELLASPWRNSVEKGKKVLLFLGRIHPKKGLVSLLQAWRQVRDSGSCSFKDWNLVMVGWDRNGHEEELKRMSKILRIDDSVHFLGPLFDERKTAAYQNADAFILPSLSEGLPMSILEAWAMKLPVLMTPQCNLPEGFTANAALRIQQSPENITHGLLELMEMSTADLDEMGKNGFLLAARNYNWEKISADLYSVYKWVLGGGSPPSCVM